MFFFKKFWPIFFILTSIHASAQNTLCISFNMNECPTCYNNLRNLRIVDPSIQLEFIFQEKYRADSTDLIKSLALNKYRAHYFWSDSMNKAMLMHGVFSSVSFSNSAQSKPYKFNLKNSFTPELAHYFNRLIKPIDTIRLEKGFITTGTAPLVYKGSNLYVLDNFKNCITKVNLINGKEDYRIYMNDTLSQIAFQKQFNNSNTWGTTRNIIEKYGLLKYQKFDVINVANSGTVNALAEYTYFLISDNKADTGETRFYVVHSFDPKGKLIRTSKINQIIENDDLISSFFKKEIKDTTLYFYINSSLWIKDNLLSLDIVSYSSPDHKGKKYFRGDFILEKDGNYSFKKFYERTLPSVYDDYEYNFTNLKYSYNGKAFALPLSDVVYYVDSPRKTVDLNIFQGKQFEGLPFEFNAIINQINLSDNIIYAFYWIKKGKQSRYLKLDTRNNKRKDIQINTENIPQEMVRYMCIDYFDYNYVIVPISNNKLLRYKVF